MRPAGGGPDLRVALRIGGRQPIEDLAGANEVGLAARRSLEGGIVVLQGVDFLTDPGNLLDKLKIILLGLGQLAAEIVDSDQAPVAGEGGDQHPRCDQAEHQPESPRACLVRQPAHAFV